jgi:hypothetical protein
MDDQPQPDKSLSGLERERRISVAEAARIKGISEDTFRRHYGNDRAG